MIEFSVGALIALFFVACLVGMIARRVHLPYSIGLVLTGFILAAAPVKWPILLSKDLVFSIILPPLIFESALAMHWGSVRKNLVPISWYAIIGVVSAALLTAFGSMYFLGWSWPVAFAFGALISATDPVSVISTFKEAGVEGDLKTQVEGESLANDGLATLLYFVALTLLSGDKVYASSVTWDFLRMLGGGLLIGWAIGRISVLLISSTRDHLIEISLTTIAAFAAFFLAESVHASGVIACVAAGLTVGFFVQSSAFTEKGQSFLHDFWEFFAFVINSLVFLLVGLAEATQDIFQHWKIGVAAFVIVLLSRAIAIYSGGVVWHFTKYRLPWKNQHVLVWGSLRGALSLVLAMSLPVDMPHREMVIAVTFFVVGASLLIQGLTMSPVLRMLGLVQK